MREKNDIYGKVFKVSNEIFVKEYEPYGNIDGAFMNKNTKLIYTAEFIDDRVVLVEVGNDFAIKKIMQGLIPFRNKLIDELDYDEKLKW